MNKELLFIMTDATAPSISDGRQLELLLAKIYRPHNTYCLHVDPRAGPAFTETVQRIAGCYSRRARGGPGAVFLVDGAAPVHWGHISLLQADLRCLAELLTRDTTWRAAVR